MTLAAIPWIWVGSLALVAAIIGAYLVSFRRRERLHRAQREESKALGIDKPTGMYPYIDPSICIGCGGCVAACPEHVLGIVGGLAVAVAGSRCIGIASCVKACPVAAIELAVGDIKSRADVPWTDEHQQTNVPGLFVVGELAGLALIRNAVGQGRDTVRWIARERPKSQDAQVFDLAIVGAGPAGLAAALTAVESRLSYVVLEQQEDLGGTIYNYPRRKLAQNQPVELPLYGLLRKEEYSKEELLQVFSGLMEKYRLNVRFGHKISAVERHDGVLHLTAPGETVRAHSVILALGRRGTPRKLGVAGEELPKVAYAVRDAEEIRGQKILCVGGGDSAIEAAMGLARQAGNQVTISYRGEGFNRAKQKNLDRLQPLLKRGRIQPIWKSTVKQIEPQRVLLATPEGDRWLENDAVFVLAGGEPPFGLLRQAGVRFGNEAPLDR